MKEISDKYEYYVVFAYDKAEHERGDVYSRHETSKAAEKAARQSGMGSFLRIKHRDEMKP